MFEKDPSLTTVNDNPSLTIVNNLYQRKYIFWSENPRSVYFSRFKQHSLQNHHKKKLFVVKLNIFQNRSFFVFWKFKNNFCLYPMHNLFGIRKRKQCCIQNLQSKCSICDQRFLHSQEIIYNMPQQYSMNWGFPLFRSKYNAFHILLLCGYLPLLL